MASEKTGFLYNDCYGGFELSKKCKELYKKETGKDLDKISIDRKDPILVKYFIKYGWKWMSVKWESQGCYVSRITLYEASHELLPYVCISEYDGLEKIGLNFYGKKRDLMEEFYKSVKDDMSNLKEEFVKLKEETTRIDTIEKKYS